MLRVQVMQSTDHHNPQSFHPIQGPRYHPLHTDMHLWPGILTAGWMMRGATLWYGGYVYK
ncbi:hypothetical protein LY76DRAFT_591129 [Colletotrichum caudatum]|nr:hypothetical protein LY76DRAFT_591129 [Colletotrichum caudatum]